MRKELVNEVYGSYDEIPSLYDDNKFDFQLTHSNIEQVLKEKRRRQIIEALKSSMTASGKMKENWMPAMIDKLSYEETEHFFSDEMHQ